MTTIDTDTMRERAQKLLDEITSGPWHSELGETYRAKSTDGMNIATANFVTLLGRLPTSEVAANIDLIAAAPDLAADNIALCDEADRLRAENERLREALTPSGETKAAYMGEFSWTEWLLDENGVEQGRERTVPWDTIKEIMGAVCARAALNGGANDA